MDARTIASVVSAAVSVCTFIAGAIAYCTIKFNDAAHAEKALNEIKTDVKEIKDILVVHGEAIAGIKATMCVRTRTKKTA
jgi:hypothetical protein